MTPSTAEHAEPTRVTVPAIVDYLIGAVFALFGLALLTGGTILVTVVDRAMIVEAVARGDVRGDMLTDAQLIDVADALSVWAGWGMILTGVLLVLVGIAFAIWRYRAGAHPQAEYLANAVRGSVVSGLLSFVPFSTAIGGAVAGYLERGESDRAISVGAVSGLVQLGPVMLLALFVLAGVVAGSTAVDEAGLAIAMVVVMLLVALVLATVGAGLGAIGGYIGGKLAEDR